MEFSKSLRTHSNSDVFKSNIEAVDDIFDFSVKEEDNKLWQQYKIYRDSVKEINQLATSKSIDDLIDPHKVASCITLSILQLKPFTLKQNINLLLIPTIPMRKVGINLLSNEVFAHRVGMTFLRFAMIHSFKSDTDRHEIVSQENIIFPSVNRYAISNEATDKYSDYVAYFLKYVNDSGSSKVYSKQNLLTLSHIYSNIESYHYLMLSVNYNLENCKRVCEVKEACKESNYNRATKHFNKDATYRLLSQR